MGWRGVWGEYTPSPYYPTQPPTDRPLVPTGRPLGRLVRHQWEGSVGGAGLRSLGPSLRLQEAPLGPKFTAQPLLRLLGTKAPPEAHFLLDTAYD